MPLNPRLARIDVNPFTRLRALLDGTPPRANLPHVLMHLGEPQHEPPPQVARIIADSAHLWNQYPPMWGTPAYRDACAGWLTARYRLPAGMITGDRHVLSLNGTKEGLYLVAALVVPQDKGGKAPVVLMPNPYYLVYNGAAAMAGAESVFLDATRETAFLPDLDAIPEAVLARTALFYLCSPGNPQGAIADLAYLKRAIALARAYDFVLAVDECYCEIYDRAPPPGALEACAALGGDLRNVLVFHSLSKRSNGAGLRCGFVAGDADLIAAFTQLRGFGGAQVPLPIQAAATWLWRDEAHVEANRVLYRRKFDVAERILAGSFGFYRPPGGFLLWLDVGDGEAAARRLWREAAVRTLPGAYTARADARGENPGRPYIRVALVHDDAIIEAGLTRMVKLLGQGERQWR
ncbi:MAG TPA: aminotransferase class I/II-fold pyridoxal phosphate-dependent enzyme [Stellaceae bacterium]|nr:aminotransferase class I/II-fold pyridoxal phosphate-dependent enzyme [Stellaceae bacterium]